jgi:glycosyltransferase involved in cell wall biosynthesis
LGLWLGQKTGALPTVATDTLLTPQPGCSPDRFSRKLGLPTLCSFQRPARSRRPTARRFVVAGRKVKSRHAHPVDPPGLCRPGRSRRNPASRTGPLPGRARPPGDDHRQPGQLPDREGARRGRMRWVDRQEPEPGITILRSLYLFRAAQELCAPRFQLFQLYGFLFLVGLGVKQVDLVWGTSPPIFQAVTAWLLARLKRVPFLFEVRDLWPAFAIAVGVLRNPLLMRASLWLERFLYRRADRVMVNSPGFIEHVTQRGARWVELVPNGADPEMFDPGWRRPPSARHHLEDRLWCCTPARTAVERPGRGAGGRPAAARSARHPFCALLAMAKRKPPAGPGRGGWR